MRLQFPYVAQFTLTSPHHQAPMSFKPTSTTNPQPDLFWACEVDYCVEVSPHTFKKKKKPQQGTTTTPWPHQPSSSKLPFLRPTSHTIPPFPTERLQNIHHLYPPHTPTSRDFLNGNQMCAGLLRSWRGRWTWFCFRASNLPPPCPTPMHSHCYSVSISHGQACWGGVAIWKLSCRWGIKGSSFSGKFWAFRSVYKHKAVYSVVSCVFLSVPSGINVFACFRFLRSQTIFQIFRN